MLDQKQDIKTMRPVPVKLQDYLNQLLIDQATTEKEKQMRIEILGMIGVMERNRACLHPLYFSQGRITWELKYPKGNLFFNGPKHPGAWGAMVRNYTLNKKFSRILGLEGQRDRELLIDAQKITDEAVQGQRKAANQEEHIGGLDMAEFQKLKGEGS